MRARLPKSHFGPRGRASPVAEGRLDKHSWTRWPSVRRVGRWAFFAGLGLRITFILKKEQTLAPDRLLGGEFPRGRELLPRPAPGRLLGEAARGAQLRLLLQGVRGHTVLLAGLQQARQSAANENGNGNGRKKTKQRHGHRGKTNRQQGHRCQKIR